MKNKFFIIFFIFTFLFQNQTISYSIEPKNFISEVVDEAKKILVASNSKEIKEKKLSEMAQKVADINGIGMYSLGSYKKILNESQLKEYNVLFQQYFLKSFTSRLADYSDPKIEVQSSEKLNEKYTMVRSVLLATDQRPEVKIDWRVYTANIDKPLIRDLVVEGLSLARTQKEEFASVIESNDGDITKLFTVLEDFINK
jgi:phospholipid transport system substrate-binding protein